MTQAPKPEETKPDRQSENTEKSSFNDKAADLIIKAVMGGSLTVGGVGAFVALFKESDVPKAIASALIGLGLSYGASLLLPLHKGNQRRLGQAGEAIDGAIDRVAEPVVAKAKGLEDQYFQCQSWACRRQQSELAQLDGIGKPLLEEVFVPLQLDRSSMLPGFKDSEELKHIAVYQFSHCIILGKSSGSTGFSK
jgi:hypothetical protein